jgi:hypothetical protein
MNLGQLEALAIIAALPDDIWLTTEEAAVVLRVSGTTLERMRQPGSTTKGPVYSQSGGGKTDEKGKAIRAAGTNQKVLYKKGDLLAWLEQNRVSDSMQAAVRKGQMFSTMRDIVEEVAFWRNPSGEIAGIVDETSLDMFIARLGKWEIEWMAAGDAVGERWESLLSQKTLASQIATILSTETQRVAAFIDRAEICRGTGAGRITGEKPPKPRP